MDDQLVQPTADLRKWPALMAIAMDALAIDPDGALCPDSDPRKMELIRLCEDPRILVEDWQRLSKSFSQQEKTAFTE